MIKQAFQSYLKSLNRKNLAEGNFKFLLTMMLIVFPLNFQKGLTFQEDISFLLSLIPFYLMFWQGHTRDAVLPKAMFLSPMGEADRRSFINYMLIFKIMAPVVLSLPLQLGYSTAYGFVPLRIFVVLFTHFSMSFSLVMTGSMVQVEGKQQFTTRDSKGGRLTAVVNILNIVIGGLLLTFTEGLCVDFAENNSKRFLVMVSVVLMFILDIIIYCKKYENIIEFGCNYEKNFQIHMIAK